MSILLITLSLWTVGCTRPRASLWMHLDWICRSDSEFSFDVWRYLGDICDTFAHDWTVLDLFHFCVLRHHTSDTCSKLTQSLIRIDMLLDHQLSCELFNTHGCFTSHKLWFSILVPSFRLGQSSGLWPLHIADDVWMNTCCRMKRGCRSGVNQRYYSKGIAKWVSCVMISL